MCTYIHTLMGVYMYLEFVSPKKVFIYLGKEIT